MSLFVRDVMIPRVLLVKATDSAKNSAKMIGKYGVSSLIVSSEEDIVGIVTERDIMTRVVAIGQNPEKVTVGHTSLFVCALPRLGRGLLPD